MKQFIRTIGLTIAVLLLWHGGLAFAAASPRIALVIGNSNYKIAPSLPNPANDARLMSKTLRGLGFDVIERIDADRETMLLATFELQDRLIAVGKDAVGLFYYAGHGVQVGGENYFIPLKTEIVQEREVPVKAVSASFVLKQMEFAGNRMNFVILDACRNNPFPASTRATTRGLARMNAPTGSLVAYSTGPGEVAADGVGGNSPYVLALTEAMQLPGVPAELMFKRVREQVLEATNDKQTPWEESSLKGGDFYFNIDVSVTVEAPGTAATSDTAATTQQESLFWQSIADSADPASFEVYLAEYPNGKFAALARLRIKQLKEVQTAAIVPPPEPATGSAVQPAVGTDTEVPEDQVTMGANIDGKWITENESVFVFSGTLDLSVASDGAVTGRYTAGLTAHGEIRGTLKRDLVTGIWIANGFSTSCDTAIEGNHSWGRFEWRFNKNFTGFEGNYSRCNGLFSYFWNGARSREALSPKVGERK